MEETIIITNRDPKSSAAEAYRTLRTNIEFSNIDRSIKSIVITSSNPNEGKSTVAINLSVAMANANKKVLLIDSDLRKPTLHLFVGVSNDTGLTNVLVEDVDYKKLVKSISDLEHLDILISGPIPPNPSELLGSNKMKIFLEKVLEDYDMIFLDSPPVGLVTDAAILSTVVDGTILICAAGETEIDQAKVAKSLLEKVNANIIGVVLNKIPIKKGKYYKYNYYYGQDKRTRVNRRKKVNNNV